MAKSMCQPESMELPKKLSAHVFLAMITGLSCFLGMATSADAGLPVIHRGINILGYDNVWSQPNQPTFKVQDLDKIKQAGLDTVRINLRPSTLQQINLNAPWLATLDGYVTAALDRHLTVIVDYHDEDNKCSTNFDICEPKLVDLWKVMASHFHNFPSTLLFEPLNEPHEPLTDSNWNLAAETLVSTIRSIDQSRGIVIGPTGFNSLGKLNALKIPDEGNNIIVTFHYYEPRKYTMQFQPVTTQGKANYFSSWGSVLERKKLDSDMTIVATWAKNHNVQIMMGEFSVWDNVPIKSRERYLAAVADAAESHGIGHIYWQFETDFSAYDRKNERWIPQIIRAIGVP